MRPKVNVLICICIFLAESLSGFSQEIELRGGATIMPGIYTSLRYEHYTNSAVNLAGGVFLEGSRKNRLSYSAMGVDLLAQYKTATDDRPVFSFKGGLGATGELVQEPWVYKDIGVSRRINYGVLADAAGVLRLTDAFSLSAFVQQKILFNKLTGSTHFIFGLGISYSLSQ